MQIARAKEHISLQIPIPNELDTLKIIGRPKFLNIQESANSKNQRVLEVVCDSPEYFSSFEAFCDLVEKNVKEKHLPPLSVFLNILRVWNWKEFRKIA